MTTLTSTDLPTRATMWHDEVNITSGNALVPTVDVSQPFNLYDIQNAPANGDTFTHSFFVQAGTYTFNVLGETRSDQGIIDWYLDGTLIVSGQDWYTAGTSYNVHKAVAGIVIPVAGKHVLKGSINGKNAGSSNYFVRLTKYWFAQVTD